jgi:hypothetical protein
MKKKKLSMLWDEFDEVHIKCISEINKLFLKIFFGKPVQIRSFAEQLHEKVYEYKKEFIKKNSKELITYNENIAGRKM